MDDVTNYACEQCELVDGDFEDCGRMREWNIRDQRGARMIWNLGSSGG